MRAYGRGPRDALNVRLATRALTFTGGETLSDCEDFIADVALGANRLRDGLGLVDCFVLAPFNSVSGRCRLSLSLFGAR